MPARRPTPSRRYVLLDRDGTVNVEKHYLADPALLELYPGVADALRQLQAKGFGLAVVTNQAGIARGKITMAQLDAVHAKLGAMLAAEGVALDGLYFCPHGPDDGCDCRKPLPGMIEQAVRELGFDPRRAFVVGDKGIDIDLGKAVGAQTILVRTGYGAETEREKRASPDFVADDLPAAARWILARVEATAS
jgi:D-glycero-D-manno-heptose 1,7-bisphosphate phosphatase